MQIELQSEENGPMEWSGRVLLGARGGEIDSPKDPSHKTPCPPPRARRSRPALGSGPIPRQPAQSDLASGAIVACWGQGSTPIASPSGCHGPPRGGRRARGRACTTCQCVPMHPGGSVRRASSQAGRTRTIDGVAQAPTRSERSARSVRRAWYWPGDGHRGSARCHSFKAGCG